MFLKKWLCVQGLYNRLLFTQRSNIVIKSYSHTNIFKLQTTLITMKKTDIFIEISSDTIKDMDIYCENNNITRDEFIERIIIEDLQI